MLRINKGNVLNSNTKYLVTQIKDRLVILNVVDIKTS
jgi:hypothetical protein